MARRGEKVISQNWECERPLGFKRENSAVFYKTVREFGAVCDN